MDFVHERIYQLLKWRQQWQHINELQEFGKERNKRLLQDLEIFSEKIRNEVLIVENLKLEKDQLVSHITRIFPLWLEAHKAKKKVDEIYTSTPNAIHHHLLSTTLKRNKVKNDFLEDGELKETSALQALNLQAVTESQIENVDNSVLPVTKLFSNRLLSQHIPKQPDGDYDLGNLSQIRALKIKRSLLLDENPHLLKINDGEYEKQNHSQSISAAALESFGRRPSSIESFKSETKNKLERKNGFLETRKKENDISILKSVKEGPSYIKTRLPNLITLQHSMNDLLSQERIYDNSFSTFKCSDANDQNKAEVQIERAGEMSLFKRAPHDSALFLQLNEHFPSTSFYNHINDSSEKNFDFKTQRLKMDVLGTSHDCGEIILKEHKLSSAPRFSSDSVNVSQATDLIKEISHPAINSSDLDITIDGGISNSSPKDGANLSDLEVSKPVNANGKAFIFESLSAKNNDDNEKKNSHSFEKNVFGNENAASKLSKDDVEKFASNNQPLQLLENEHVQPMVQKIRSKERSKEMPFKKLNISARVSPNKLSMQGEKKIMTDGKNRKPKTIPSSPNDSEDSFFDQGVATDHLIYQAFLKNRLNMQSADSSSDDDIEREVEEIVNIETTAFINSSSLYSKQHVTDEPNSFPEKQEKVTTKMMTESSSSATSEQEQIKNKSQNTDQKGLLSALKFDLDSDSDVVLDAKDAATSDRDDFSFYD